MKHTIRELRAYELEEMGERKTSWLDHLRYWLAMRVI